MSTENAVHPLLSHLDVNFIKGLISQPRSLEVSSLHLFLQSLYMYVKSLLNPSWSFVNDGIHWSKSFWGPGFLESRPTCTCERQRESLLLHKSRLCQDFK